MYLLFVFFVCFVLWFVCLFVCLFVYLFLIKIDVFCLFIYLFLIKIDDKTYLTDTLKLIVKLILQV